MKQQLAEWVLIAVLIGCALAYMINHAYEVDKAVAQYEGTVTIPNLKAEGWRVQHDADGNIYYTQRNYVLRAK